MPRYSLSPPLVLLDRVLRWCFMMSAGLTMLLLFAELAPRWSHVGLAIQLISLGLLIVLLPLKRPRHLFLYPLLLTVAISICEPTLPPYQLPNIISQAAPFAVVTLILGDLIQRRAVPIWRPQRLVVWNGRVDLIEAACFFQLDPVQLRQQLEQQGCQLRSASDGGTLVKLAPILTFLTTTTDSGGADAP